MKARRGTVLVAVMVIISLSALAAGVLLYHARAEVTAATAASRGEQAYVTARAGLSRTMAVLTAAGGLRGIHRIV